MVAGPEAQQQKKGSHPNLIGKQVKRLPEPDSRQGQKLQEPDREVGTEVTGREAGSGIKGT